MEDAVKKISTGAAGLDKLLGGGLESRVITNFLGKPVLEKSFA